MQYQALVFDFFGVISSEVSPFWFAEHLPSGATALKQQYLQPADRGEVSQEALFAQLSSLTGIRGSEIENDWLHRARMDTELLAFIKNELRGTYKLGLLSNSMAPYFHSVSAQAGLSEIFDHIVISAEIGHAKPEPEAFLEILSRLQVSAEETLMIDDSQTNLDGAARVGMPGHLYTSFQELQAFLGR